MNNSLPTTIFPTDKALDAPNARSFLADHPTLDNHQRLAYMVKHNLFDLNEAAKLHSSNKLKSWTLKLRELSFSLIINGMGITISLPQTADFKCGYQGTNSIVSEIIVGHKLSGLLNNDGETTSTIHKLLPVDSDKFYLRIVVNLKVDLSDSGDFTVHPPKIQIMNFYHVDVPEVPLLNLVAPINTCTVGHGFWCWADDVVHELPEVIDVYTSADIDQMIEATEEIVDNRERIKEIMFIPNRLNKFPKKEVGIPERVKGLIVDFDDINGPRLVEVQLEFDKIETGIKITPGCRTLTVSLNRVKLISEGENLDTLVPNLRVTGSFKVQIYTLSETIAIKDIDITITSDNPEIVVSKLSGFLMKYPE